MFIFFPALRKALNVSNTCQIYMDEQDVSDPEKTNGHTDAAVQTIPLIIIHHGSGDKEPIAFDTVEERDRIFKAMMGAIGQKEEQCYGTGSKIIQPSLALRQ